MIAVHLACVALLLVDFAARTWRTRWFLAALGHPLGVRDVFVQSALGEAASSLTPLRVGGELSRVWAMREAGVPARAATVCVATELAATTPVIALAGGLLGVTVGREWWADAGPGLVRSLAGGWPWIAAVAAASAVAWAAVRRLAPSAAHAFGRELREARAHAGDIPARAYAASVPLTLVNVAARVAVLPILSVALPDPPPLAATVVGSFALLYAQAFLPTPAGAGAVELGFLGGAAGELGAAEAELLVLWRFYTTVLGSALGVVLAVAHFRWAIVPAGVRRRLGVGPVATSDDR